jgi:hypothetical protein
VVQGLVLWPTLIHTFIITNCLFYIVRVDSLLGNDRKTNNETTLAARRQILNKQQLNYNSEEQCFLSDPSRDVISRTVWSSSSVVEYYPAGNNMSTVAEEYPLLKTVTRKRLVETVTHWECVVTSWVYEWPINLITNPNPVCSHSYTWQYIILHFV